MDAGTTAKYLELIASHMRENGNTNELVKKVDSILAHIGTRNEAALAIEAISYLHATQEDFNEAMNQLIFEMAGRRKRPLKEVFLDYAKKAWLSQPPSTQ